MPHFSVGEDEEVPKEPGKVAQHLHDQDQEEENGDGQGEEKMKVTKMMLAVMMMKMVRIYWHLKILALNSSIYIFSKGSAAIIHFLRSITFSMVNADIIHFRMELLPASSMKKYKKVTTTTKMDQLFQEAKRSKKNVANKPKSIDTLKYQ